MHQQLFQHLEPNVSAEENQDPEAALDGTIQKMHQTFQKFFYNSPATDNQIVELIVGPTHFLPENYLSVKSSNGSSYKSLIYILEILDYIWTSGHTLKPESLSLVDNVGLTSDLLNAGIHDHIFGDSLAINGDPQITGQLLLNPDVLVTFLHEPQSPPKHAILTVNPEYIDGGVQDLEAKTVERFKTNITHVSFKSNFLSPIRPSTTLTTMNYSRRM
ncbi:hypothetical protein DdX_14104 [Ditylenchus destructor]|uniref:Uncharacterized protein n=1 Tax=Ditylenchus destructor TaxID=166010 RepID=A0AAD4MXL4_9BILA|nr:hypothetical protein DdX_14104 [Ditylenchus destructor]